MNAEIHISELEKLVAVKFQALWIPSDEKRPPETGIAGGRLARTPHAFSLQCLTTDAYVRFSFVGRSSDALRRGLPIEKRSDGFRLLGIRRLRMAGLSLVAKIQHRVLESGR